MDFTFRLLVLQILFSYIRQRSRRGWSFSVSKIRNCPKAALPTTIGFRAGILSASYMLVYEAASALDVIPMSSRYWRHA